MELSPLQFHVMSLLLLQDDQTSHAYELRKLLASRRHLDVPLGTLSDTLKKLRGWGLVRMEWRIKASKTGRRDCHFATLTPEGLTILWKAEKEMTAEVQACSGSLEDIALWRKRTQRGEAGGETHA